LLILPVLPISRAIVLPAPGICSNFCKLDDSIERRLRYYSPNTIHSDKITEKKEKGKEKMEDGENLVV